MVTIIHGGNIVLSRKKLDEYITDSWTIRLDAQSDDIFKITNSFEFRELFSQKKTIIIENLFSPKVKDKDKIIDLINGIKKGKIDIVIWTDRELNQKEIKKIEDASVIFYDLPKFFYSLLDSLSPKNSLQTRKLLQKTLKESTDVQIFYSIVKRIRQLLIIKTGRYQDFEEFKTSRDWQIRKLQTQAKYWKETELVNIHNKLFVLEYGLKTSELPMNLADHIDFLLLTL